MGGPMNPLLMQLLGMQSQNISDPQQPFPLEPPPSPMPQVPQPQEPPTALGQGGPTHKMVLKSMLGDFLYSLGHGLQASAMASPSGAFGAGFGAALTAPFERQKQEQEMRFKMDQAALAAERENRLAEAQENYARRMEVQNELTRQQIAASQARTLYDAAGKGYRVNAQGQIEAIPVSQLSEEKKAEIKATEALAKQREAGKPISLAEKKYQTVLNSYAAIAGKRPEDLTDTEKAQAENLHKVAGGTGFAAAFVNTHGRMPTDKELLDAQVRIRQALGNVSGLSSDAIRGLSTMLAAGDTTALSVWSGIAGVGAKTAVVNAAFANGQNPDLSLARADRAANTTALTKLVTMKNNVVAYKKMAGANLQMAVNIGKKIVDSGSPWINIPLREVNRGALGNEDLAAWNAANQVAVNEIARVITNPNLIGVLSDNARKEVEAFLPREATLAQVIEVAKVLDYDMSNREKYLSEQIDSLRKSIAAKPGPNIGAAIRATDENLKRQQYSKSTGLYRHSLDGGKTWTPGRLPK